MRQTIAHVRDMMLGLHRELDARSDIIAEDRAMLHALSERLRYVESQQNLNTRAAATTDRVLRSHGAALSKLERNQLKIIYALGGVAGTTSGPVIERVLALLH